MQEVKRILRLAAPGNEGNGLPEEGSGEEPVVCSEEACPRR